MIPHFVVGIIKKKITGEIMIKLKDGEVILFQGDSITDGNRGRNSDPNHIHGHGYQYILAAEMLADNIGKNVEVYNRGISGNRIADLYGRWKEDCINLKPTILSILIGFNDVGSMFCDENGSEPVRFERIYRQLLDEVLEHNPETFIVIMEPFFGESKDSMFNDYCKKHISEYSEVSRRVAEDYGAVFVELQDIFDEYKEKTDIYKLLWDGVHPTTAGHHLIAKRWKERVKNSINSR